MGINPQDLSALGLAALINILILVFFCKSLIKALSYISPENKKVVSSTVWLLLVPGLNLIINFIVVFGMSKSIANELERRDFEVTRRRPTFDYGIIYAILSLGPLIALFPIPEKYAVAVTVISFSQIFFFVQYWMKINWYKSVLQNDDESAAVKKEE